MDVLNPSEDLVQQELVVIISERLLRLKDTIKIGLHKIIDNIEVFEVDLLSWFQDCLNGNDLYNAHLILIHYRAARVGGS